MVCGAGGGEGNDREQCPTDHAELIEKWAVSSVIQKEKISMSGDKHQAPLCLLWGRSKLYHGAPMVPWPYLKPMLFCAHPIEKLF